MAYRTGVVGVLVGPAGVLAECLAVPRAVLEVAHRLGILDPFGILARLGVLDLLGLGTVPAAAPAASAAPAPARARTRPDLDPARELVLLPADHAPALVYLASLTANSRRAARTYLRAMATAVRADADVGTFAWHALRWQHVQALRARMRDRYAPGGVRNAMSALRGTLRTAHRLGLLDAADLLGALDATRAG